MRQTPNADLNRPSPKEYGHVTKTPLIVVLDNVRSALNVGSIFRTCDAFAIQRVYLCGITATPPHRDILKTALGSTDTVDWSSESDTATLITNLRAAGHTVLAVEQTDRKMWLQDIKPVSSAPATVLVFGNEVRGVSVAALAACEGAVEVPQFGTKHSLNIAVCAGVVLWEFTRRLRLTQATNGINY